MIYPFTSEYINVGYLVFLFSYIIVVLKLWIQMEIFHTDLLLFLFHTLADKNTARPLYLLHSIYTWCFMGLVTFLPVLSLNPNSIHCVVPNWYPTFSFHHDQWALLTMTHGNYYDWCTYMELTQPCAILRYCLWFCLIMLLILPIYLSCLSTRSSHK